VLRDQLGHEVDELFDEFQEEPIASGSVGQVHRARLRPEFSLDGGQGRLRDVAVKVRHPGVADSAFMDLDILWNVVQFSQRFLHMTVPFVRGEFDEVIRAQMDFTREAFNLQKFARNFKGEHRIRFPKVSPKYVTTEVLVETWAEGKVISNIMEDFDNAKSSCQDALNTVASKKKELQGKLCNLLYDMSMKMMVRDNFVHGDLHGGNILYSEGDDHVTVLDAGIATKLQEQTIKPFGKFLYALCSGNTKGIVNYLQHFNEAQISVNLPDFTRDIQKTMDKYMGPLREHPELPVNAADMFGEVLFTMQRHCMLLKGDVASTLFTITISEGLIRQLDPTFDVAGAALPYIARHTPGVLIGLGTNAAESN
jgi:predicted unusual protein kinase regulating ubiquinone biosynthesis (AarF/ABC1/UbiB family)